jgi:Ca2+-binding EF-hand superfamily protein
MNGDGVLDRNEARRSGFFASSFDAMDRDGDGKVTEKEMLAWLDQMDQLRNLAARSCVSLSFSNEGRGLFDLIDSNGDGRLSVRELRNASKVLARLGKSDTLAPGDVPRHFRGEVALGPNGGRNPFVRTVVFDGRRDVRGGRAASGRGPLWFQRMDRNRDGDVSRKEFLGDDEHFKEIDTDGDGLISLEEAIRYDKRKRPDRD